LGNSGFYYKPDDTGDFARAVEDALDAGPTWTPSYTAESVTWSRRTEEFLRELPAVIAK
jgi:hypothetical protein